MLRVVVDPNVVVSAAISPTGVTGRLVRLGLAGQFRMVVCPRLLEEASDALSRPKKAAGWFAEIERNVSEEALWEETPSVAEQLAAHFARLGLSDTT